jgi:signal transduction histidine kinase/GAF domain-containing protein
MLADLLDGTRDRLADELAYRAASAGLAEPPLAARRLRLRTLVEELIEELRRGGAEAPARPSTGLMARSDQALEVRERELVQRYLIGEIEQEHLEASPRETAIVARWAMQAERARLREQCQRLSALLDGVKESAAVLAPDGRLLYCNRRAFQRLHQVVRVPREEIIGKTFADLGLVPELVVGCSLGQLVPAARAHESRELTFLGRTKESQFDAIYQPDGTVAAVAVVIRDIHRRRQARTRLALLSKLGELVGMSDPDQLVEALVRVPIPELADWCTINLLENGRIRRTVVAHADPSKAPLRDAIMRNPPAWERHPLWQELLTGGFQLLTEVSDDMLRRFATNEERYRLLSLVGLRSLMVAPLVSRGQIFGILSLAYTAESGRRYGRDAPALVEEVALHAGHAFENARLMKDLKASEGRFRIALAAARTLVFEQDAALRYVWSYAPVARGNVLGKTHEESFPPEEAATLTKIKRRVLDEGVNVDEELDLTFGGQESRHYRETIEPMRDHDGKVVGLIGAATDITEQQRMRQQLAEELTFHERMTGILGHDLRNPLTVIAMAADRQLRSEDLPQEGRDQALRIRRSAGRMREMIDTLLDFTRLRFLGGLSVSPVPADLGEIARGAVEEMRAIWPERPMELEVHGDVRGEWDPARMSQTVSNLVGNAVTHGERGTPVQISVEGEGGEVDLEVHNWGAPIPPDLMPAVFEPFRHGALQDRSPRGLGLGLYIVEQIAVAHGGTVNVSSSAEDGTTFTVRLPRKGGVVGAS